MILSIFKNPSRQSKCLLAMTILLLAVVNISIAQVTHRWNPTTGGPNFPWNNFNNWIDPSTGFPPLAPPSATSIVQFNSLGATTCRLPAFSSVTIQGLLISPPFTGIIDLNGSNLTVNTAAATDVSISAGNISNTGFFPAGVFINTSFAVSITGVTTVAAAPPNSPSFNVTLNTAGTPTGVSVSSSTFNGNFKVSSPDNINLTGNTFKSGTTINKTLGTNYSLGGLTVNAPVNTFGGGFNSFVTIQNSGSGVFTYSNDTYNVPLTILNTGTGTLTVDLITANKNLTVTQNSGILNACNTGDCKVAGNLSVNGAVAGPFSFGNGLATSGAMEFIGGAAQIVSIAAPVSALSFAKLNINKTAPQTVTMNTNVDVTVSSTMSQGIFVMGSNTITFIDPSIVTGYNNTSFVDGLVKYLSGSGAVTFPTGASGNIYRPITINFSAPDGPLPKSARYFNSAAPSFGSHLLPITNVSEWEYWSVNASPSSNFTATLPWKNADTGNPNYVQDETKLRVSRFSAGQWQDNGGSASTSGPFSPLPVAGIITSSPINTASANIGNLTLGSISIVNQLSPPQCRWLPPSGSASWNTAAKWDCGHVPTAADIAIFDQGNSTCVLPAASVTVGALQFLSPFFTGSIDLNGVSLNVNAIAPILLSTGNITNSIGSGSLVINGGTYSVDISGITAATTAAVNVTGNAITVGSSVLNGSFTGSSPSIISLTGNVTMGNLIFSTSLNLNGYSMTLNGNNVTNTFTNGSITNSGSANTIFITSTGSGGTTINGTTFGAGVNLSINSTGTTATTVSGGAVFNSDVSLQSPDVYLNGATFNGTGANTVTVTKTGTVANTWTVGNTFNVDATIVNQGTGSLSLSTPGQDTFNKNLTIKQSGSGSLSPCNNCKLARDFTWNIGSGPLGNVEFIGSAAQMVTASFAPIFSNLTLNKTGAGIVTILCGVGYISVTNLLTLTNGIIDVSATGLDLGFGSYTGGSNVSFVRGYMGWSGAGPFTYPTGDNNRYRPATISPNANAFSVRYYATTPPNYLTVNGIDNVSQCEYWAMQAFNPPNASITLSWVSTDCITPGTSYINSLANLRVAYKAIQWKSIGNVSTTGSVAAGTGTITSSLSNFPAGNFQGYFTLGSVNSALDPLLPIVLTEFSGVLLPKGVVQLDWETASEIDNDHFEIERANDQLNFIKLGEVPGNGTTHAVHEYSFMDQSPLSGLGYYRLRQVDFNGQSTYSKIIAVTNENENENSRLTIYPNPVAAETVLFLSRKDNFEVIDGFGNRVIKTRDVSQLDLKGLRTGIYIVIASNGQSVRFVVK